MSFLPADETEKTVEKKFHRVQRNRFDGIYSRYSAVVAKASTLFTIEPKYNLVTEYHWETDNNDQQTNG